MQPREGIDQGLLTSGHQSHLDFAYGIESVLKNSGVPVSQMQQLSPNMLSIDIASKEEGKQAKEDLLVYADAFHCAKWLIKAKAHACNYEVGFLPQCSSGASNFFKLAVPTLLPLEGDALRHWLLQSRLQLYFPSLNSLRRLAENSKELLTSDGKTGELSCLSTDANVYLMFADLLSQAPIQSKTEKDTIEAPTTFREALALLEASLEVTPACMGDCEQTKAYYDALVQHEIKSFYATASSFEMDRVY